jgi:hypothetical protein
MTHVPEQSGADDISVTNDEGTPKFGRLLIVLIFTVFLLAVITWASEAYWS